MTKEKQIEEMARGICGLITSDGCFCDGGYCNYNCLSYEKAEALYNAGYRKIHDDNLIQCVCYALGCQAAEKIKAEVAREIFELVECAFSPVCDYDGYTIRRYLAELKKEYTEGEG